MLLCANNYCFILTALCVLEWELAVPVFKTCFLWWNATWESIFQNDWSRYICREIHKTKCNITLVFFFISLNFFTFKNTFLYFYYVQIYNINIWYNKNVQCNRFQESPFNFVQVGSHLSVDVPMIISTQHLWGKTIFTGESQLSNFLVTCSGCGEIQTKWYEYYL